MSEYDSIAVRLYVIVLVSISVMLYYLYFIVCLSGILAQDCIFADLSIHIL